MTAASTDFPFVAETTNGARKYRDKIGKFLQQASPDFAEDLETLVASDDPDMI